MWDGCGCGINVCINWLHLELWTMLPTKPLHLIVVSWITLFLMGQFSQLLLNSYYISMFFISIEFLERGLLIYNICWNNIIVQNHFSKNYTIRNFKRLAGITRTRVFRVEFISTIAYTFILFYYFVLITWLNVEMTPYILFVLQ